MTDVQKNVLGLPLQSSALRLYTNLYQILIKKKIRRVPPDVTQFFVSINPLKNRANDITIDGPLF